MAGAKCSSNPEPMCVTLSHKPHHQHRFTSARAEHCFSGETVYVHKGLGMGKMQPLLQQIWCTFISPLALLSFHWTRSLHLPPLSTRNSACVCVTYRAGTFFTTLFLHPLYQGKVVFHLKISPPSTPYRKAVEFPLFEKDIYTYSNSWLIKKVSVDGCQEYVA